MSGKNSGTYKHQSLMDVDTASKDARIVGITQHRVAVSVAQPSPAIVTEHGQVWDMVALVRYPSRQAFADMIRDPDYRAISHFRNEALAEAVLQPTTPLAT